MASTDKSNHQIVNAKQLLEALNEELPKDMKVADPLSADNLSYVSALEKLAGKVDAYLQTAHNEVLDTINDPGIGFGNILIELEKVHALPASVRLLATLKEFQNGGFNCNSDGLIKVVEPCLVELQHTGVSLRFGAAHDNVQKWEDLKSFEKPHDDVWKWEDLRNFGGTRDDVQKFEDSEKFRDNADVWKREDLESFVNGEEDKITP